MRLYLHGDAVWPYIEDAFGGIAGIVDAWRNSKTSENARAETAIYGWLNEGLPRQIDTVLELFGILDLDPLAALDLEKSGILKNFRDLRLHFLMSRAYGGGRYRAFDPLFALYYPGITWPSSDHLRHRYQHDWHTVDFDHHPDKNDSGRYAAVSVEFGDEVRRTTPAALHIAYKHGQATDDLWRPYGSIVHRLGRNLLFHENGYRQEQEWPSFGIIRFETYYGPSPLHFRLASVHPFKVSKIEVPSRLSQPLRFPGR